MADAFTDERAKAVFLTLHLTGIRRHELQALTWGHVSLTEGTLRVVVSKSEEGERLIALAPTLVGVLTSRYRLTPLKSETDYVFAYPRPGRSSAATGTPSTSGRHSPPPTFRKRTDPAVPRRQARRADAPGPDAWRVRARPDGYRRAPVVPDDQAIPALGRPAAIPEAAAALENDFWRVESSTHLT